MPLVGVMMDTLLGLHVGEYKLPTPFFKCDRSGLLDTKSDKLLTWCLYNVAPLKYYLHIEFYIFLIITKDKSNNNTPPLNTNHI